MAFRFVHTADLHLDSPLRSLALRDPTLAELVGNATRQAFVAIIDLCLDEQVDALVIAGDLYDGDQTSMKTAQFLVAQLRRLHVAGIVVYITRGNHDAMSRITKELTFDGSAVTIFTHKADMHLPNRIGGSPVVAVHGVSFRDRHAPDSLLPGFQPPRPDTINIGIMHTSLDGAPNHDVYAPSSLAELQASGFRYWALGHIHRRAAHTGETTVVMPGMPQGRDIGEAGAKTATLVTVADDGSITVAEHATSVAQFEQFGLDLTGIADWPAMVDALEAVLQHARTAATAPQLVARLVLTGTSALDWRLRRDPDLLLGEAQARAAATGGCWIDRVQVATAPPPAVAGHADPLDDLRQLMGGNALQDAGYRSELAAIAAELQRALPGECRDLLGGDPAAVATLMDRLAQDGAATVLARLRRVPEPG
jgi:exonuclease SbcD